MRAKNGCKRTVGSEACILRKSAAVILALAVFALAGPAALAGGGGGDEGHGDAHHEAHFGKEMVFQIVNFVLLVCLLLYVYRRNASGGFEKRSLEIQTAMEEAAEAKKAAEDKYLEYQTRVAQLDQEIGRIQELSRGDAEKERLSIVEEAKKQSEKIVQQAELTARHEVELAKQQLRKEAADLAANMASDAIRKATTRDDQRNWVKAYIDKIGEVQ